MKPDEAINLADSGDRTPDDPHSCLADEVRRLRAEVEELTKKNAAQEEILSDICDYFDDDETNADWELYEKTKAILGRR